MPLRPVAVTRRSLVGAALLGTAGCSLGSADPSDPPTYTPSSSPDGDGGTTEATADPDAALVEDARAALSTAYRTAQATARTYPQLADELRPLVRLHRAHAGELGGLVDGGGGGGRRTEPLARARRRVTAAEDELQQALVTASVQADSGALAQLLASMAASVAQHRSVL